MGRVARSLCAQRTSSGVVEAIADVAEDDGAAL